ncbi:hypothetical protein C3L33_20874, partial [Rhododendron williamsianum]
MTSLLRKFLPSPSPKSPKNRDDGDDYSVEYSFAVEYSGPPVSHDIPLVVPIDFDRIPTASVVVTASMLSNLSLPVVQPFSKSNLLRNKLSRELKPGSKADISTNLASHSGELGLIDVEEGIPKVSHGIDSSGTLGFSDSRDDSQELSGSSEVEEDLRDDAEVGLDLDEGESCSRALSPEIHSIEGEEDCISVATDGDPESSDVSRELTDHYDPEIFRRRASVKKGLCNRCNQRKQFTKKVVCIVCGAQYCGNCVVRAMGSMPEGRKCIPCIGLPIDESKRGSLGKSSWMLRQLLSDSEVKVVMRFEISCKANQLPPRLIHVNVSGFWGKEGEKPCQIISAQLAVGYQISLEASNGDTNIRINNRKITKAELWMLQLAGIQCEGAPHFWVSEDGSYQEEGQNNVMGKIWDKVRWNKASLCRLIFANTSKGTNPSGGEVANPANGVLPNFLQQKTLNKLLLVGCDKSGTSTIFKQAKMVYNVPFSEDERQSIKLQIQSSLYGYLGILLEGGNGLRKNGSCGNINEENIYSINPRLKAFSDWLLEVVISGNLDTFFRPSREYAPLIEDIWKDKAFQATYDRRNELHMPLPRIANYFLDRGTCKQPWENCKWLEMFEDTDLVLYCVSLTDYDQFSDNTNGVSSNKMLESKRLFESIVTHPTFHRKNVLLILNKFDLLEEKIEQTPLTRCEWFHDFNPVISHNQSSTSSSYNNPSLAQRAFNYIAVKFKKLFFSLTGGRKLYVSRVTGLEPDWLMKLLDIPERF